jgi:RNase P subunit RPR2
MTMKKRKECLYHRYRGFNVRSGIATSSNELEVYYMCKKCGVGVRYPTKHRNSKDCKEWASKRADRERISNEMLGRVNRIMR